MTTKIGDLAVRIFADTGELASGLSKAKDGLKEVASEARAGATSVAKYGAAAAAAGAAVAAAMVVSSAEAAKEIKNLSNIANTSTATFQKMAYGAKTVGIEQDKLSDILKDFNDRVGDFNTTGGGAMKDFFEKIAPKVGVTAESFKNLSGDQALQLYVSSLEKANLSQADMTFYMEAMASDSTALLPLLKNNGKAMAEQAKHAEELGLVLSDIQTANLVALNKNIDSSKDIFSSLSSQLTAEFSPALSRVFKDFESIVKEAGGVGKVAKDGFNVAIDAGVFLANAVDGVGRTFEVLGKSAAIVGLGIGETMLSVADFIVNRPVQAVNELIEALNSLPIGADLTPVSLTGFGETIQHELGIMRSAIDIGLKDIDAILMRPMAGNAFKKYVETADKSGKAAVDAIEKSKASEADSLGEWDAVINGMLDQEREKRFTKAAEDEQFLNDLVAAGRQKHYEILAESHEKQRVLDEAEYAARKAALGNVLDNLASLMGSKSRKMFEIGKVAAIANTVVSTMQGAQQAYTALSGIPIVGPSLGVAAAGAAIAAGAVRVQAINAQSFSKGTVSGAAANQTAQNIGNQVATGQTASQIQYVRGINPGDLYSGAQLVELINNAQANGARLQLL